MSPFVLLISDLHLQQATPDVTERFVHFMQNIAPKAQALYILGDFFETWIGDDDNTPYQQHIINLLQQLHQSGVKLYFIPGNRDFLIGKKFAEKTGITILPDPSVITIFNQTLLLGHGDALCTLDTKHQKFRRVALNPIIQKIFLALPLWLRRKMANKIRQKSGRHHIGHECHIMDVTPSEVEKTMLAHKVSLFIHGHTHRPAIHQLKLNGQNARRIVLGAWHDHADYVQIDATGRVELIPLAP